MNILETVNPTRPAAPYLGGKRLLAKTLIEMINTVAHEIYVEPFCGMGGVFFRRDHKPPCEVINDLNGELTNFFRILQRHRQPLEEMLQHSVHSRAEFNRLSSVDVSSLTDLERAYRFIYLQKTAFGGQVVGKKFGVRLDGYSLYNPQNLIRLLKRLHERLCGVMIECLPYQACIDRYDRPETLFYLDPPYFGSEDSYGADLFDQSDFEKMADQLRQIKGRFILSINDTPEIRNIFKGFAMDEARVRYTISTSESPMAKELIITN
jgi:DNA adenine methylase